MQANLFDQLQDTLEPIRHPLDNAELLEYPNFFDMALADRLLVELQSGIPWQQEYLRIAGKLRAVPRLQCWMGDRASEYGYSGVRLSPRPWDATVQRIRERIGELCDTEFNSVLINYYRTGQDSVAWHADDEPELGPSPIIASVSLGAERVFQLKPKHQPGARHYKLRLRHGSLLVMGATMQQHWLHQLPKVKGLEAPRINLTFRNIQARGTQK